MFISDNRETLKANKVVQR